MKKNAQLMKQKHTVSSLQAAMRALYGFSPGWILTPERSSSLFLASVDSRAELILKSFDVDFETVFDSLARSNPYLLWSDAPSVWL